MQGLDRLRSEPWAARLPSLCRHAMWQLVESDLQDPDAHDIPCSGQRTRRSERFARVVAVLQATLSCLAN